MSRWLLRLVLPALVFGVGWGQMAQPSAQHSAQQQALPPDEGKKPEVELPPEEDAAAKPEQFSFNPVKSKRDVEVGIYYLKKGDYKGAVERFVDATKWNDGNAEAWMYLGQGWEKLNDAKAAREAYQRYLHLAPDAKNVPEVRKRLARLL